MAGNVAPAQAGQLSAQEVADIKARIASSREDVKVDTIDKIPYEVDHIMITQDDADSGTWTSGTANTRSKVFQYTVPAGYYLEFFARDPNQYFLASLKESAASGTELDGQSVDVEVHKPKNRGMKFRIFAGLTTEMNDSASYRINSTPLTFQGGGRALPGNEIHLYITNGSTSATTFGSTGSSFAFRVKLLTELRR